MKSTDEAPARRESAILAGGCFWCLEAAFAELRGVEHVESGYMGGDVERPTYQQVCAGTTGHAEVVRVDYDPDIIAFSDLLDVFFTIHDPTTPNRQGADIGTQYRSAIYHLTPEQKTIAAAKIAELENEGVWSGIVTEVTAAGTFWPAESYHRDYYSNNPEQAYCRVVIAPKIAKLRQHHLEKLRA
jgi:peptide-methionine (S)-S-oxide reductase